VSPDPQLKEAIPSKIARSFKILPIELREKVLSVAAANPADSNMVREVEFMTGYHLKIYVTMQCMLKDRIDLQQPRLKPSPSIQSVKF